MQSCTELVLPIATNGPALAEGGDFFSTQVQ